ncbi:hypothetical protein NE237_032441 [Protea cynaroides]|uniref:Uncharacterized protein n=1 Tax=Protea cynaroides TaxID=273540 RepID=A0A9Q0L3D1_9MAGN|nr:hypothetical protein NE237_032441 [Protea cynaroides]
MGAADIVMQGETKEVAVKEEVGEKEEKDKGGVKELDKENVDLQEKVIQESPETDFRVSNQRTLNPSNPLRAVLEGARPRAQVPPSQPPPSSSDTHFSCAYNCSSWVSLFSWIQRNSVREWPEFMVSFIIWSSFATSMAAGILHLVFQRASTNGVGVALVAFALANALYACG